MTTLRHTLILVAAVLAVHARDISSLVAGRGDHFQTVGTGTHNVILIVADGLRWQEVFRGADPALINDARFVGGDVAAARRKYWRPTVSERRETLMPFLWTTVARQGQLFGNRDVGSAARVTNPMWFSYPGYNEMLVGYPDPRINRNDFGPNPNVTVFEWLNGHAEFRGHVGAIGTWTIFRDIFNERRSGLYVADLDNDALSHEAAMRYIERRRPRALFVGFGQTDDWAHKGRYDRTLDAAHAIDRYLSRMWSAIQSTPQYRGRTTLIVVADHGRGRTSRDWKDHGREIDGADETWFAVIGPRIPALGELQGVAPVTLAQAAATVARAVGLDYVRAVPRAAPAIDAGARQPAVALVP